MTEDQIRAFTADTFSKPLDAWLKSLAKDKKGKPAMHYAVLADYFAFVLGGLAGALTNDDALATKRLTKKTGEYMAGAMVEGSKNLEAFFERSSKGGIQ